MSGLAWEQYETLTAGVHPSRVRQVQGQSHLEAWDIRRHLIRIFGYGGWDFEVVSCDLVADKTVPPTSDNGKPRYTVVYRVVGRLSVRRPDGFPLARYEDGATGDAVNQPSLGDAHDMAMKTAMSQALKRCAVNLGDQFGLSLYDNGRTEPSVMRSLVHPEAPAEPEQAADGES